MGTIVTIGLSALIAAAFIVGVKRTLRKFTSGDCCSGGCSGCGAKCASEKCAK